jgi:class 3 adenylate cyclase
MSAISPELRGDPPEGSGDLSLDAFVPALIRRRIALDPGPQTEPAVERFPAALMLADLSGFAAAAETLARRGARGAEDLKDLVNLFFGRLVEAVHRHGGQVLKFPGDATLAVWPADAGGVVAALRHATECALEAQQALHAGTPNGLRLQMRAGVGVGAVSAATVGGVEGRWELLVTGDPLTQAVQALSVASPGEVVVSLEVHQQLTPYAQTSRLGDRAFRVDSVTALPPTTPPGPWPLGAEATVHLRAYVPRAIQARLDAGHTNWLAEFRRVSVLFIDLGRLECGDDETLAQLQRAVVAVQTATYRYGGSINQLVADDKGTVVVCGWGLALHAHADDPVRAVRAALELRGHLKELGFDGAFGLATGEVFTGLRGNRLRCEYAMIGDVVNVAARLMHAAGGGILCDLASCEGAASRFQFETLDAIAVKGRLRPVPVFRPIHASAGGPADIVGRVPERRALRDRLEMLVRQGHGGVVILEGDAGIGKSRLVADVVERAAARGARAIVAAGDDIERSTPYHVWRTVFDNLLGLEGMDGREAVERRVLALLEPNRDLLPFAALLNPVIGLNLPDTERSRRVPPRGRAVLTRDLLVHLFQDSTGGQPTLLALEDAHWFDSAAWALALGIQRQVRGILLLIAMRPVSQAERPPELLSLRALEDTLVLKLDGLTADETGTLACQRLRARVLSEPVARLIRDKAEGHPFFAEELVHALRDRGLVEIDGGVCRFTAAADQSVQLPNAVHVVVNSRIDQLTVPQQLTLKVASVLGRTFDLTTLRAIYPKEVEDTDLSGHLRALVERDLVHFSTTAQTYSFKHAITQEVAYGLLTYELRRRLHAAVGSWYERQHAHLLAPFYPLLAHHWGRAEVADRTLLYLDKAGEQALGRYANEEAAGFFKEALTVDAKLEAQVASEAPVRLGRNRLVSARDVRRLRWHRRLGDAYISLGRWAEGQRHFDEAFSLAGYPLPASDRWYAIGLGGELLVQCARRLGPRANRPSSAEAVEILRELVLAYQRVGANKYLHDHMLPVIYTLVAALNMAERLGPTSEFALVCADVGNVLGLVPLRGLARAYHRRARETAAGLSDPVLAARVAARTAVGRLGIGDWTASRDLEAFMAVCDQIGDSYLWEESAAVRARVAHLKGEFDLAAGLGTEIRRRAAATGSLGHEIWGVDSEVWSALFLGHHETALELAETGFGLLAKATPTDRLALLDFLGASALVHLRRNQWSQAQQAADRIAGEMAKAPRLGYFAILGLSAAAETFLALWEAAGTSSGASSVATQALRLCRLVERYARVHPPARARAFLWRGWAESLEGRPQAALASWHRCLQEAEGFALPYETARAHFEIGRRLPVTDAGRRRHLVLAEDGFRGLKADADLKRATEALVRD